MKAQERPAVFLSCLGTTNYRELAYSSGNEPEHPTRFVQIARLRALQARRVDLHAACVLVTAKARQMNWEDFPHPAGVTPLPGPGTTVKGLQSALAEAGLSANAVDIPDGATETEFWEIFGRVAEQIPEDADVYVDLTHGFRTLPVLVLLALEYVQKAKGASIRELTYGADRAEQNGVAPTWNLAPFLILREWVIALSSFLQDGDTRPLARKTLEIRRALKQNMPPALAKLPKAFEQFGEAVIKCHSPSVGMLAAHLRNLAHEAQEEVAHHVAVKPLGLILSKVQQALADFPADPTTGAGHLKAQAAAVRWCLRHRLAMQAVTFLREALVTALSHLSEAASSKPRREQDELIGALDALAAGREPRPGWQADQARAWCEAPPIQADLWQQLGPALSRLMIFRNELDHAYVNESAASKPRSDPKWRQACESTLNVLDGLIECPPPSVKPDPPENPRTTPRMLVLLSHVLTSEQESDARESWGVQEVESAPRSILDRWSNLDPESDLPESLLTQIGDWLRERARPGDLLLVQGEAGMTWLVAHEAQDLNLTPVYSVTRRDARDQPGPDGTVTRTSVFRHVRFRAYPACAEGRPRVMGP
ncbi:MAG: CRISPR-associated protein Csx20 [Candidatus Eremiobacterota bacterium]